MINCEFSNLLRNHPYILSAYFWTLSDPPTTQVCLASFLSGGYITAIVVNPTERKLAKHTSVHCTRVTKPLEIIVNTNIFCFFLDVSEQ